MFHERGGSIIPISGVDPKSEVCGAFKPFDTSDPNEFTGPMPRAVSGIFSLGPQDEGFVIEPKDDPKSLCQGKMTVVLGDQQLCPKGNLNETMGWTWQNKSISGVFIRFRWNEVHKSPSVPSLPVADPK